MLLTGGVRNRLISTDAILPDSASAVSQRTWDARVGLMYFRKLDGDRMMGGGVNVGSASDHPFASIDEMNVSMMAMYRMPSGQRNAWMFMLMYSPVGELKFPIPGVSYSYNPSDQFHANIGLPFSLSYQPTDRWSFDASYMLIHTIHVKAAYKIAERLKSFAATIGRTRSTCCATEPEDNDRFFHVRSARDARTGNAREPLSHGGAGRRLCVRSLLVHRPELGFRRHRPREHRSGAFRGDQHQLAKINRRSVWVLCHRLLLG